MQLINIVQGGPEVNTTKFEAIWTYIVRVIQDFPYVVLCTDFSPNRPPWVYFDPKKVEKFKRHNFEFWQ